MPWIDIVPESEAQGKLKEVYQKVRDPKTGQVPTVIKILSFNPDLWERYAAFFRELMFGPSRLSRAQREMIATVVSATNHCQYCTTHHGTYLRKVTKDDELVKALQQDYRRANLSDSDKAMLRYAEKLTREPDSVRKAHIEELKTHGFDDRDIWDINQIASLFNYINRVTLGLGAELEDTYQSSYEAIGEGSR